jgi:opacity protein-like surface antigen
MFGGSPMLKKFLFGAVALVAIASSVVAADVITVALKDMKLKVAKGINNSDGVQYVENDSKIAFYTNGTATADVKVPEDGEYTLSIEMSCDEAQGEKAQVKIAVDEIVLKDKFDLTQAAAKEYTFSAKLKKGDAKLVIEFLNDKYKENEYDLNLYLHAITIKKK